MPRRRLIIGLGLAALSGAATAQTAFPTRPVRVIVPFAPGAATDILARTMAEGLASLWPQPVVVENRTGASGNIGAEAVARAPKDGHTLLMGTIGTNAVNAALFARMPYDTLADFAPILHVADVPMLLLVHPSVPARSVAELVALARTRPLNMGTAGIGASQHLAALLFERASGARFENVTYRGFAALMPDLLNGRLDLAFADPVSTLQQVRAGQLRALAVTTRDRHPLLPDLPTLAESGFPDYAAAAWYGLFAPSGLPESPAARRVSIVPDPASNSLVIAADENEWEGVRALLRKLDTAEYDTSRQLSVIPLKHADAASVARALNEGLRAPVQERLVREQARRQQGGNRRPDENELPTVLVDSEPTPTVAAETVTNSLVVFAGRNDTERIRSLVQTIDVPDFQRLPQAHVLPLSSGKASQVAAAVRELYQGQSRGGAGARSVVIVGDDTSNSLIVRAEERELAQIRALAETLQQQGDASRTTVRILTLSHIPAPRLQRTIAQTFSAAARQQNEPLAVEVDRAANALVVASTGRMFNEIQRVVRELDEAAGAGKAGPEIREIPAGAGPGATILIIDITNNAPEDVRRQLEQLGVTQPAREDRPNGRAVSE
ncbi:hypothetical protein J4558_27455 [Leptolyngbya sp. 15MV]|nr:hypothetical protein J4558_27455 [Leptolyngbya sp. 15MV]